MAVLRTGWTEGQKVWVGRYTGLICGESISSPKMSTTHDDMMVKFCVVWIQVKSEKCIHTVALKLHKF
jgi:hypothetical protein